MADIPKQFAGSMVLAMLGGRKTQTRRALTAPKWSTGLADMELCDDGIDAIATVSGCFAKVNLGYAVGDRIYVREHWRTFGGAGMDDTTPPRDLSPQTVWYEADGLIAPDLFGGKFRQAMHMPRWASRITLIVSEVRVQRLQEISEADAIAEGIDRVDYDGPDPQFEGCFGWRDYSGGVHALVPFHAAKPRLSYQSLWDSLNGQRDEGVYAWAKDPWVVAVSFNVIKQNIDQVQP